MAETHELRLKIDASAAKTGAGEFLGAIKAVQAAVIALEKDSSGVFKKLDKTIQSIQSTKNVKVTSVDKRSVNALESYSNKLAKTFKEISRTRRSTHSLRDAVDRLGVSYDGAKGKLDGYNTEIIRSLALLKRQRDEANLTANAMKTVPSKMTGKVSASSQTTTRSRSHTAQPKGGGGEKAFLDSAKNIRAVEKALAGAQNKSEGLTTSLMKVEGWQTISKVGNALRKLQQALSKGDISAEEFAEAMHKFNLQAVKAGTSLTTLRAKTQDQARADKEAADAAKAAGKANAAGAKTAADKARDEARLTAISLRLASAQRTSATEAQRLGERMKAIGKTDGFSALEKANNRLSKALSGNITSTKQIEKAVSKYKDAIHTMNIALIAEEGAHRRASSATNEHARAQRNLINNARAIEQQMRSQSGAANATARSFHGLTGNMRGLENAFNATYQAGTLFRNMLGGLTLGTFIKSVYDAGTSLQQFMVTMEIAAGSTSGAFEQLEFIGSLADRFGTNIRTAREDFSKFAVASDLAGVSVSDTQKIFESVSMAMSVMGRGADDQRLAFLALEQMMSKNSVSSEELRRQLGERLPGSVSLMAKAVGVTTAELQKMLKAGSLVSSEVLPKFADEVNKAFGPGMEKAATRASKNLGTLQNEFDRFLTAIANSGFMDVLAAEFSELTNLMRSSEIKDFAKSIGHQLGTMAQVGGDALQFLVTNTDRVREALTTLFVGLALSKGAQFVGFLATAGQQLAAMLSYITQGRTASFAASGSTDLYTASLTRNTTATTANAVQQGLLAGALTSVTTAQTGAATGGSKFSKGLVGTERAVGTTTGRIGALAGRLGAVASVFGIVAPVIGVAGLALAGYSLYAQRASQVTDEMASDVEGALRRSGARFKDYSNEIRQSAAELQQIQDVIDFKALSNASGKADVLSQFNDELSSLSVLTETLNGKDLGFFQSLDSIGVSKDALAGFSAETKTMAINAYDMMQAMLNGDVAAASFIKTMTRNKLDNAQFAGLADTFLKIGAASEQLERGRIATGQKVAKSSGGPDAQRLLSIANAGAEALDTGEGFLELKNSAADLVKEFPHLEDKVNSILQKFRQVNNSGGSSGTFLNSAIGIIAPLVTELEVAAQVAEDAKKVLYTERGKFVSELSNAMSTSPSASISMDNVYEFERVVKGVVEDNKKAIVSKEMLDEALGQFKSPNAQMQDYLNLVKEMFTALPKGEQTYEGLNRVMEEAGDKAGIAGGKFSTTGQRILSMARAELLAKESTSGLYDELIKLGLTEAQIEKIIAPLLESAEIIVSLDEAAQQADSSVDEVAQRILESGEAAKKSNPSLEAYLATLGLMAGLREDLSKPLDDFNIDMETRRKAASLDGRDLEIFNARQKGGEIYEAVNPFDEQIAEIRRSMADAAGRSDYIVKLSRELADLQELRARTEREAAEALNKTLDMEEAADLSRSQAKKAERSKNKTPKESDYAKNIKRMATDREGYIGSLRKEAIALDLVASGQVKTLEGARLLADAMMSGNSQAVSATQAMLGQADAAQRLVDAMTEIRDINESQEDYMKSLEEQNLALALLADGQVQSIEHAEMLARAMMTGEAASIDQTRAFLQQAEAAETLYKKLSILAADPVKEWVKSVPTWKEAGDAIEVGVIESVSDSLSNMIKTGKFSFAELGKSILGTAADILADMAVREMLSMFGLDGSDDKKAGFGLGDSLQKMMGYSKGSIYDPKNGGIPDAGAVIESTSAGAVLEAGIIRGAAQAANMLAAAIAGAPTKNAGDLGFTLPEGVGEIGNYGRQQAFGQASGNAFALSNASQYLGMAETVDNASLQKLLTVDPKVTAWCADFVNQTLAKSGVKGTGQLNAKSFLDWGQDASSNPQVGDVAVFDRGKKNDWQGHVGYINALREDGSMDILGGNQGNSVSVQNMTTDRLLGVRRASTTETFGATGMGAEGSGINGTEIGTQIAGEMRTAGTDVSSQFNQAFSSGGVSFGEQFQQTGMNVANTMGSQVTRSGSAAALSMGSQVTTAGSVSGSTMGSQVTSASAQGASQMQQGIVSGSSQGAQMLGQAAAASGAANPMGGAPAGGGLFGGMGGTFLSLGLGLVSSLFSNSGSSGGSSDDDDDYDERPSEFYGHGDQPNDGRNIQSDAVNTTDRAKASFTPMYGSGEGMGAKIGDISTNITVTGADYGDDPEAFAEMMSEGLNQKIQEKINENARYGGVLNPR